MQTLFIIALFGALYGMVASLVMSMAESSAAYRNFRVAKVERVFKDIETGVTDILLGRQSDMAGLNDISQNTPDFTTISDAVSWTIEDLSTDPWGNPYQMIARFVPAPRRNVYDGLGGTVEAPMWAYALISPGENGVISAALQADIGAIADDRDVLRLVPAAGTDDIVHTFSTREVMTDIWNGVYRRYVKTAEAIQNDYKQQHLEFLPAIEAYYEAEMDVDVDISDLLNSWYTDAGLQGAAGYPVMNAAVDTLSSEAATAPMPFDITAASPGDDWLMNLTLDTGVAGTNARLWSGSITFQLNGVEDL